MICSDGRKLSEITISTGEIPLQNFNWERKNLFSDSSLGHEAPPSINRMSSLAATQSDGFYFPPEWRPEFGGLSKYQGSKGANQYQTHGIIRFELPFDAWCLKCGKHMSKGLRFNAKKDKAPEKYFTTQIWAFSMRCPNPDCDQNFVIKTDPENDTYNMTEGMRKMDQDFEPELNDSIIVATTDEERHLLVTDPMFRLQHEKEDRRRALSAKEHLESLIDLQSYQKERDYDMNAHLRCGSRQKRKRAVQLSEEGRKRGLSIPLLEPHESDSFAAKSAVFTGDRSTSVGIAERSKMVILQSESIFDERFRPRTDRVHGSKQKACVMRVMSSSAKKQKVVAIAMAKQAVINIDTKKLRLSVHTASSSDMELVPTLKNLLKVKRGSSHQCPAVISQTTFIKNDALDMLSLYSESCVD